MPSLLEQNRWLRDPKQRERLLRNSAATSSAVEGIRKPFADTKINRPSSPKVVMASTARAHRSD